MEAAAGGPEAVIDVYVKLVDEKNNAVVTTKRFHACVPAASGDAGAGIQALNSAFQQVTLAIVSWVSHRTA